MAQRGASEHTDPQEPGKPCHLHPHACVGIDGPPKALFRITHVLGPALTHICSTHPPLAQAIADCSPVPLRIERCQIGPHFVRLAGRHDPSRMHFNVTLSDSAAELTSCSTPNHQGVVVVANPKAMSLGLGWCCPSAYPPARLRSSLRIATRKRLSRHETRF